MGLVAGCFRGSAAGSPFKPKTPTDDDLEIKPLSFQVSWALGAFICYFAQYFCQSTYFVGLVLAKPSQNRPICLYILSVHVV